MNKNIIYKSFLGLIFAFIGELLSSALVYEIGIVFFSILTCINTKRYKELIIVSSIIAWSNYSIVMCQADLLGGGMTTYTRYVGTPVGLQGLEILYLFTVCLFVLTTNLRTCRVDVRNNYFEDYPTFNGFQSKVVFSILVSLVLIISIGFALSEFYGLEAISKSLFEYCVMFYILGFNVARHNKKRWRTMILLVFLGLIIDLALRDRIVPLEMMIMIYVLHYQYKLTKKQLLILGSVGLLLMVFLGNNREDQTLNSSSLLESFSYITDRKMTLDTAYAAYYCSLTELDFGQDMSFDEVIPFIKSYVIYIFLGTSYQNETANLAQYVYENGYSHTFGNVTPLFFFFYLKYVGIFVFSMLVAIFYRLTLWGQSSYAKCVSLYFITLCFRWYLYGPSSILRGVLIFSFLYFVFCKVLCKTDK